MKKILLISTLLFTVSYIYAQQKVQALTLLVTIDEVLDQDVINGQFFIRDKNSQTVDQMPFRAWVGRLEMTKKDYKKLFKVSPKDTLYMSFETRSFELDTEYNYEAKIPRTMMNNRYLIFKIYNKKNKESDTRYAIPNDKGYVIRVVMPGYNTILKSHKSN